MKKFAVPVAILFFFVSLQLKAQPGVPPQQKSAEEIAEQKTAMISEKTGLDGKQYAKVYKLYLAQAKEMFSGMRSPTRPTGMEGGPGAMRGGPDGGPGGMRGGPPGGGMWGGPGGMPQGMPAVEMGEGFAERMPEGIGPGEYEEPEKNVRKREKKMKKILTAEQFGQWQVIEREMRYQRFRELHMKLEPD